MTSEIGIDELARRLVTYVARWQAEGDDAATFEAAKMLLEVAAARIARDKPHGAKVAPDAGPADGERCAGSASEEVPRRYRLDRQTPAEAAIRHAIDAVEAAGCDPCLTDAVNLLIAAREKVGDFVDGDAKEPR